MLGGLNYLNDLDVANSSKVLAKMANLVPGFTPRRAADLGGGIGRVSLQVLGRHFEYVDLVDQNPKFLEKAMTVC